MENVEITEVKELVSKARLADALALLLEKKPNKEDEKNFRLLQARYAKNEDDFHKGINADYWIVLAKINLATLHFLDEMEEKTSKKNSHILGVSLKLKALTHAKLIGTDYKIESIYGLIGNIEIQNRGKDKLTNLRIELIMPDTLKPRNSFKSVEAFIHSQETYTIESLAISHFSSIGRYQIGEFLESKAIITIFSDQGYSSHEFALRNCLYARGKSVTTADFI